MRAKWLIDTRVDTDLEDRLAAAVRATGRECWETTYVPFADPGGDVGPMPVTWNPGWPVVVRGCHQFVDHPRIKEKGWLGRYAPDESFRYSVYCRKLRRFMLNWSFIRCSWGFYKATSRNEHFVRPDDGTKAFQGQLISSNAAERQRQIEVIDARPDTTEDMKVIVAAPRTILAEYRFVVVDGIPVAGSQYRHRGVLDIRDDFDEGALDIAKQVGATWRPDDVFVCDVAEAPDGFRVVEINAFSCSGLYQCDLPIIVEAVSWMTEKRYNHGAATVAR